MSGGQGECYTLYIAFIYCVSTLYIVSGGRGECYTLYSAFIYRVLVYCELRAGLVLHIVHCIYLPCVSVL